MAARNALGSSIGLAWSGCDGVCLRRWLAQATFAELGINHQHAGRQCDQLDPWYLVDRDGVVDCRAKTVSDLPGDRL